MTEPEPCISLSKLRQWWTLHRCTDRRYSALTHDIDEISQPILASESLFEGSWKVADSGFNGEYIEFSVDESFEKDAAEGKDFSIESSAEEDTVFYLSSSYRKDRSSMSASSWKPAYSSSSLDEEFIEFSIDEDEWIGDMAKKKRSVTAFEIEDDTTYTSSYSSSSDREDTFSRAFLSNIRPRWEKDGEYSSCSRSIRWSDEVEGQELETIHTVPWGERANNGLRPRHVRCRVEI
jgi:hypothetical protein